MTVKTPLLQSSTLALAAVAALGLGLLGGLAAHPVMKPAPGSDWRERYRAVAPAPMVDDGAEYGGAYGFGYGYGWAARLVDAGAARFAEAAPEPDLRWTSDTDPALIAGPEPDLSALDSRDSHGWSAERADGRAVGTGDAASEPTTVNAAPAGYPAFDDSAPDDLAPDDPGPAGDGAQSAPRRPDAA